MGVPTGVTEELALERDFELPVLLSPKAAEERGENHFVEEEVMEPSPLQPKPQSVADFAKWQLLALGAHIGWGCYPVLARRLQNPAVMPEGVEPIPVLQLLFVLNIIASMWLALYLALGALYNRWIGAGQTADQDQRAQWSIKTTWVTITLCVVQFARALTNLSSAKFTLARWISMMNLTTPLWSALLDTFLGKPLKPYTIQAILASAGASALVLFAGTEDNKLTMNDILGLSLQLLSSFCLCLYMHTVQATSGLLTENEVLYWSNASLILFAGVGSLIVDARSDQSWARPLERLDSEGWLLLILFALLVYFGAALVQQYAVRRIGATAVATLMPVRLFAAVIGGMLLLGEPLRNALEGLGLLSLVAIVLAFIRVNSQTESRQQGLATQAVVDGDSDYLPVETSSVRGFSKRVVRTNHQVDNGIQ